MVEEQFAYINEQIEHLAAYQCELNGKVVRVDFQMHFTMLEVALETYFQTLIRQLGALFVKLRQKK